jgi:hypothetical protein
MKLRVGRMFEIGISLDKLLSQQNELPLNVGYDLWKMKKQFDEIGSYVFERIKLVIPEERLAKNELDENEMAIYQMILGSEVEIVPFSVSKEMLFKNENIRLTVSEIADIMELFDEKTVNNEPTGNF